MLEKISIALACFAATTAFAMIVSIHPKPIRQHNKINPTIVCWPDEDARTCWRNAEHRHG